MNFSDDSKPDPAILLLNAMEKLLAQTRLMELHLEQARAAGEEKITRLQEQVQQLEGLRRSNEEENAELRHQVITQERALTGRHEALTAVELALHGRIQSLQQDLALRLREVAERDSVIEMLNSEAAALHRRIAQLAPKTPAPESAGTNGEEFAARLEAEDERSSAAQTSVRESEKRLSAKVHELQIQLADKQLLVDRRAIEIEDLRAVITRLSAQLAVQDCAKREAKGEVINRSGAIRTPSSARITGRKEQEFAMKTDDQDEPLSRGAAEIEDAPKANRDPALRDELKRLIHEAQEKNKILQDRNEELVRVKAELDPLHERLNQLESSRSETETALRDDAERMRTEFQAQLALLQAELSQREWTLEEREAVARGLEQKLRQEIESLRQQLAESKAAKQYDAEAFVFGEPRASDAHERHLEGSGDRDHNGAYSGSFANQRRWHSGFGWKRRWRS